MVCFALVALLAFALLADVRLSYDQPFFKGLTPELARTTWTLLLLAIEATCLLVLVLLLLVPPRAPRDDAGQGTPDTAEAWVVDEPSTGGPQVQIGCPGCGTIFVKPLVDVDEEHEQDFDCPNCGRQGHLRLGLHKSAALRDVHCASCDQLYTAYRDAAECPHCHAPN